jgi:fermentation-respiration switch protein FrsA (DUF1100 family)
MQGDQVTATTSEAATAELPAPNNREDVEFDSAGVTLRGWYYRAETTQTTAPTIVMAHGYAAVKEMYLDKYAERFSAAGMNVLVYDNRNLGASDGQPRQEINPWVQIEDYRNAITFAEGLPGTDRHRIGIWGSSYSGGHALVVAAMDRRVKAVSSQVPQIDGNATFRETVRADFIDAVRAEFDEDRRARFYGAQPVMIDVVSEDPMADSVMPSPDAYQWFMGTHKLRAPSFVNQCTLQSVEMTTNYHPGSYLPLISPTPLLMCVAENDVVTPTHLALASYETALQPKKLVVLPGGHFDAYTKAFELTAGEQTEWFAKHLLAEA